MLSCGGCVVCLQILKGNLNLVNSSFPVSMFEPRSYLQKLADIWAYPDYINAAAAQQDPLERMKLLVTWMVAGGSKQLTGCLCRTVCQHWRLSLLNSTLLLGWPVACQWRQITTSRAWAMMLGSTY